MAASPERDEKQKDGPIANKVVMAASPNLGEEEEDGAQMSDAAPDMELTPRGLGVVAWHVARQVFVIKINVRWDLLNYSGSRKEGPEAQVAENVRTSMPTPKLLHHPDMLPWSVPILSTAGPWPGRHADPQVHPDDQIDSQAPCTCAQGKTGYDRIEQQQIAWTRK